MKRIVILFFLLSSSIFAKAGLDATLVFGVYADGEQGSSSNLVLEEGKFTLLFENETLGCVKTEIDAVKMGLSVTCGQSGTRNVIKIATRVFDDCGTGAKTGDVLKVTITINDLSSPLHGRSGSVRLKLASGVANFFINPTTAPVDYKPGVDIIDLTASGYVKKYGINFITTTM